ncbi:hypothetical protein ACKWTF_006939 [Chironomus riparius]
MKQRNEEKTGKSALHKLNPILQPSLPSNQKVSIIKAKSLIKYCSSWETRYVAKRSAKYVYKINQLARMVHKNKEKYNNIDKLFQLLRELEFKLQDIRDIAIEHQFSSAQFKTYLNGNSEINMEFSSSEEDDDSNNELLMGTSHPTTANTSNTNRFKQLECYYPFNQFF